MRSRFSSSISILAVIVYGSKSDLTSRFVEDSIFYDSDLPLDPPELSFNQPAPPSDQLASFFGPARFIGESASDSADAPGLFDLAGSSEDPGFFSMDASEPLLWNLDDSIPVPSGESGLTASSLPEDVFFDDSFDVAACSASEQLPGFGKTRIKRLDDPKVCPNPLTESLPDTGSIPVDEPEDENPNVAIYNRLLRIPELRALAAQVKSDENDLCVLRSEGSLPYGFCPTPLSTISIITHSRYRLGRSIQTCTLTRARSGMWPEAIHPAPIPVNLECNGC